MKKEQTVAGVFVVLVVSLAWSGEVFGQINLGVGGSSPFGNYGPYVTRPFGSSPGYSSFGPSFGPGYNTYPNYTVLPGSYPSLYYNAPYNRPPVELNGGSTFPLFSQNWKSGFPSSYPYTSGSVLSNPNKSTYLFYPSSSDLVQENKQKAPTTDIQVKVPVPTAEVTFGGIKTKQQGLVRAFVTPPLEPGKTFHYEIEARWLENGKTVEQTRKVSFTAGETKVVDFTQAK